MNEHSEPNIADLLTLFCSQDEAKAARAFEQLAIPTRRGLHAFLRQRLHSEEAREDVVQDVLRRLWMRRQQFENQGASAWWSLVRLAAEQCRIDLVRKVGTEVSWVESEVGEVPNEDLPAMQSLIETLDEREALYAAADEVWLGFETQLTAQERARRTLAAHLFFNQGMTWSQVCDLLNRNNTGAKVTRAQLDRWLEHPSTIRALAFRTLYRSNTQLAIHLLGLADENELHRIGRFAASGDESQDPPKGWTWPEVRIIVWRYREAERQDKILAKKLCALDKQELKALCDRCLNIFPFPKLMEQLNADLIKWPHAQKELKAAELWQRLVFEYYGKDTSIHQDIHDRTSPAAALVPYSLTLGMLNVWLSNGRLAAKLAAYVRDGRNPN